MWFRILISCVFAAIGASNAFAENLPGGSGKDSPPGGSRHPGWVESPAALVRRVTSQSPPWLKLGGEIRGRSENWIGLGGVPGRDNSYYLHRLRLNATLLAGRWVRLVAQAQDSREVGYDRYPVPFTVANPLDLRQGYVELGAGTAEAPWMVRVGRQPLIFGDMRLVSTSNWGNVGANYDAVRVGLRHHAVRLEGFTSMVVIPQEGFDRPRQDRKLSGLYASFGTPGKSATIDGYLFRKNNPGVTGLSTVGVRGAGRIPLGFDYNVEVALQRGRVAGEDASAWAGHWEIGNRLEAGGGRIRLAMEYNTATGDQTPHDGRYETFDSLYPTNIYGTAGDFGWRNLHEPVANVECQATRNTKIKIAYHEFWLAERGDALYTFSGAVFVANPKATQNHVGSEIDVRWIVQMNKYLQLWIGYAHLFPGAYLKEAGRGAIDYPYAMWTYSF